MIDPLLFGLVAGLFGLIIYVGIVFWAGRKRMWWLALLLTVPAMLGGLMSLTIDMSQSSSPLFQNYGWLVIGQYIIGLITYFVGRFSVRPASDQS